MRDDTFPARRDALRARRHLALVHSDDSTRIRRMEKLTRADLFTLEAYAEARDGFRARVISHKQARRVPLGANINLLFEDRLTVQYQVQEMLRIERIFEAGAIQDELDAYNPLVPDGANLKATMLIEFPDPEERKRELARLGGIEHRVYAQVQGQGRVPAIADEDLERSEGGKSAAVHFLRFEFAPAAIMALRAGAALAFGIDDARLPLELAVPEATRLALLADFA
ncbi:hypothetical protein N790_05205 [Arenimonas malthae CC-JY-1]|uniref:DUF3501 domain-containing protein n=1 Tax=Arenimonas malthae CC-JY-1 TaxID=1384054 RepID=A0A091BFM1_9GAMM|nr:DUF3501 family protein [Arenimonas malthae]KFN50526.1 hypothetical protein N790_05205 [Arenimonas malthae CC-JY-1]